MASATPRRRKARNWQTAGSANKRTREIADRAIEEGLSPLEYMLAGVRDETAYCGRRDDIAKSAAPYVHPRLASTSVTGDKAHPVAVVSYEDTRKSLNEFLAEWKEKNAAD